MSEQVKGKSIIIQVVLFLMAILGLYLMIAWASYSPLDNAWSVSSSLSRETLNKGGAFGAWLIDLLQVSFGGLTFLPLFTVLFVPIYLLVFNANGQLNGKNCVCWLAGFILLLLGLSSLATALLPHSAHYLSGGILGQMLVDWLGGYLGIIGAILIAAVFTAVGFYLCSGKILVELFNRLYRWIRAEELSTTPATTAHLDPTSFNEEKQNIADLAEENHDDQVNIALTDPSQFPNPNRPNIKGLRKTEHDVSTLVSDLTQQHSLVDVSIFPAKEDMARPSVNVPRQAESESVESVVLEPFQAEFSPVATDLNAIQVRLAPQDSAPSQPLSELQNMPPNAPLEPISQTTAPVIPVVQTPEPEVVVPKPMAEQAVSSQPYPASYGDSLIHPLLQKQRVLEKPTTPLPTLDLLTQMPPQAQQITESEIRETSARIEKELANFGVKATVEAVLEGPVVTRYEIKPAAGIKASKISSLGSDLARALIFKAIRITDVVPGKPFMGIETPNRYRETVWLREVLESEAFRNSKAILPMALGKSISGEPVVVDMAKMPHLLVAGQTGGGKSVGVNTMILSLLFKMTPEQVRFIMIDPKVVELSIYNDIPHLLTPVVTDMKKAENALRWAVEEMERRYLLVSSLSVRNIEGYNDKIRQAAEMGLPIPNPLWRPGDTMDALPPPLEKMTYIVLIVDEFADLMMSAGKQVEDHIMRIAQKARAVGIHLILATQRPSTDVITGVIKANIPSRIAFTVASQIDSRTILDKGGAETLLGRGDMLYSESGSPEIIRVHGAFMTDDDVQRVADNWRARGKPSYIDSIVESANEEAENNEKGQGGDLDPLFDEVLEYFINSNTTSANSIQRRFSIGFPRASRIIDQMEQQGILSTPDKRNKRELLVR